jgi:hypothetical protein
MGGFHQWREPEPCQLGESHYDIAVDEFAEL